uniref:Uncharacterized protein n=1 Tax=Anguilla anguilla TaxID=7936 RepID=A0A0E9VLK8_ANGAN
MPFGSFPFLFFGSQMPCARYGPGKSFPGQP